MSETPQELYELEQQKWLPVINWVNEKHELNLHPSYSVTELATIPEDSRLKLYRHISSMGFPALNGMLYGVGTIKSVLLMLACLQAHLSVEETVHLAYLEQAYQTKIYKKVRTLLGWGETFRNSLSQICKN
jgi:chaperone required for assembly of F1-ATPase